MTRAAAVCALVALACSDNPYVIGHAAVDAAAPDAGPRDAGAPDAGDECAAERSAALVCSGFEGADVAAEWDRTTIQQSGVLERSTARAHSGTGSLHASSTAAMSMAVVRRDFAAVLTGDLYARVYLYVPAGLPTRTINVLFLGAGPMLEPFVGVDLNIEDGAPQVYSPQGDPQRQTGTAVLPRDRWFCLRVRMAIADDGFVEVFADDELVLNATGIDTSPADGVAAFRVGVDWSSEQDDFFEVFIDDVVLDLEPVACL